MLSLINMESTCKFWIFFGLILLNASFVRCDESESTDTDDKDTPTEETGEDDDLEEEEVYEDNGVLILHQDNFDKVVNSHETILVEFYAPWCGHCKRLAPEYERAAETLKDADPPVALAKVDATEEGELAQKYGVSGYPALKFFKNGEVFDYDGPREESDVKTTSLAEGIVNYMTERGKPKWKPPPPSVLTLTSENFTEVVFSEELILVEFYAPWCGHCKTLAPEYEKAAKELQTYKPPIPLAAVDATAATDLASKYEVTGYPTLKIFRKGRIFDYSGGRDKWGFVNHMAKMQGPPSEEVKTVKSVKDFIKEDDITVVGFFNDEESPLFEIYEDTASEIREDFTFGHTFSEEARKFYKVKPNTVVVFNSPHFYTKFEKKWYTLEITEETPRSEIKEFIEKNKLPLVGQYGFSTKEKRYKDKRPLVLVFYTVDWSFDHRDATQLVRQKVASIAQDYKDSGLTFAVASEEDFADLVKGFGLDESGEDVNVGILGEKDAKFPMEAQDFEDDSFREFLDTFLEGKMKPRIKSQPIPKKKKGPVTVVVGNNFEKVVMDKNKDVLIEFYAPWCGHCKALEPAYKELAKKYKKNKKLVIAKLDATANDVPENYASQGYPTIYFAPTNKKDDPIRFDGEARTIEGLENFLKAHVTVPLDGPSKKDEL